MLEALRRTPILHETTPVVSDESAATGESGERTVVEEGDA